MQSTAESEVDRLEAELVALSARMNAAEYVMLERIRELEDVISIQDWTFPQWLSWRLNMATATAYERVRVARALKGLPSISGAFAEGRLTYSKVRILTRMANAETDATYLQYALVMSVHQLETLVAKHRKFSTEEAEQQMQRRFFQITEDDDGMFVVKGRLAPDDAAILLKALQAADPDQPRIDALVQVAKAAIEGLATGDDAILHVARLLCTKHHRLLHEGRFTIDATGVVRNQHGVVLRHSPAVAKADSIWFDLPDATDPCGRDVWDGDRVDWDTALSALL